LRCAIFGIPVINEDSKADTDLGGGQANARSLIHGFKHVLHQLAQAIVKDSHVLGFGVEDWVTSDTDWSYRHLINLP